MSGSGQKNCRCADCDARNPTWASVNLGVFICETCAGIHRSLGTHISKVKSVKLDNWKPAEVNTCRNIGNAVAKAYYEHDVPIRERYSGEVKASGDKVSIADGKKLETWIRAKYVKEKYAPPGSLAPCKRLERGELVDSASNGVFGRASPVESTRKLRGGSRERRDVSSLERESGKSGDKKNATNLGSIENHGSVKTVQGIESERSVSRRSLKATNKVMASCDVEKSPASPGLAGRSRKTKSREHHKRVSISDGAKGVSKASPSIEPTFSPYSDFAASPWADDAAFRVIPSDKHQLPGSFVPMWADDPVVMSLPSNRNPELTERHASLAHVARLFTMPTSFGVAADVPLVVPFGFDLQRAEFDRGALSRSMGRKSSKAKASLAGDPVNCSSTSTPAYSHRSLLNEREKERPGPAVDGSLGAAFPPQVFPVEAFTAQAFPAQTCPAQEFPAPTFPPAFPATGFPASAFPAPAFSVNHDDVVSKEQYQHVCNDLAQLWQEMSELRSECNHFRENQNMIGQSVMMLQSHEAELSATAMPIEQYQQVSSNIAQLQQEITELRNEYGGVRERQHMIGQSIMMLQSCEENMEAKVEDLRNAVSQPHRSTSSMPPPPPLENFPSGRYFNPTQVSSLSAESGYKPQIQEDIGPLPVCSDVPTISDTVEDSIPGRAATDPEYRRHRHHNSKKAHDGLIGPTESVRERGSVKKKGSKKRTNEVASMNCQMEWSDQRVPSEMGECMPSPDGDDIKQSPTEGHRLEEPIWNSAPTGWEAGHPGPPEPHTQSEIHQTCGYHDTAQQPVQAPSWHQVLEAEDPDWYQRSSMPVDQYCSRGGRPEESGWCGAAEKHAAHPGFDVKPANGSPSWYGVAGQEMHPPGLDPWTYSTHLGIPRPDLNPSWSDGVQYQQELHAQSTDPGLRYPPMQQMFSEGHAASGNDPAWSGAPCPPMHFMQDTWGHGHELGGPDFDGQSASQLPPCDRYGGAVKDAESNVFTRMNSLQCYDDYNAYYPEHQMQPGTMHPSTLHDPNASESQTHSAPLEPDSSSWSDTEDSTQESQTHTFADAVPTGHMHGQSDANLFGGQEDNDDLRKEINLSSLLDSNHNNDMHYAPGGAAWELPWILSGTPAVKSDAPVKSHVPMKSTQVAMPPPKNNTQLHDLAWAYSSPRVEAIDSEESLSEKNGKLRSQIQEGEHGNYSNAHSAWFNSPGPTMPLQPEQHPAWPNPAGPSPSAESMPPWLEVTRDSQTTWPPATQPPHAYA